MTVRENLANKLNRMKKQLAEVESALKGELPREDRTYYESVKAGAQANIRDYEHLLKTLKHLDDQID